MTVQSIVLRKSAYNLEQANEQVREMGHTGAVHFCKK